MGTESLSHSRIGDKIKRGAVATVAAVSSFGIVQEALSQEASASTPTSNQLLQYDFNTLSMMMKTGKDKPVEGVTSKITDSHSSYGGDWNTVTETLTSADGTTETQISLMINAIPNKNGMHLSSFNVSVYPGPHKIYSIGIFSSYRVYNTYAFHGNYDGWQVQEFGHAITSKNKEEIGTNYYWGIGIPGMNPNEPLKPVQISRINSLFVGARQAIYDAKNGYVIRNFPTTAANGAVHSHFRFTPPGNK